MSRAQNLPLQIIIKAALRSIFLSPALALQGRVQTHVADLRPIVDLGRGLATFASRPSIPATHASCRKTSGSSKCSPGCSCCQQGTVEGSRGFADVCRLKPKFQGGKIKLRTSYKERFKAMKDGTVKLFPPGFRHRRFRKNNTQRLRLKQPQRMHQTYANTLRRMGFM